MIAFGRPPAPLWELAFDRLAEILLGVKYDQSLDAWAGDVDGQQFKVYRADPWQMVFASSRRGDLIDFLARSNRLSRREVWRALEQARGERLELPAVIRGSGGYGSGPSPEALQYATGGRG